MSEGQGGTKYDGGKAPLSLIDPYAQMEEARVLLYGAEKYDAFNWRGGIAYSRLLDAALRHIHAFIDGEDADPESGLPHIAHARCNLGFLLRMCLDRPDLDDRYKRKDRRE